MPLPEGSGILYFWLILNLLGGDLFALCSAGSGELAFKTIYATGGIDQLLLTSEKRVATRANFDTDVAFVGRTGLELVSASASDVDLIVCRVYSSFHTKPFREL